MGKVTRGKDGKLYYGKGTKGGLAPTPPSKNVTNNKLPKLPEVLEPVKSETTLSTKKKPSTVLLNSLNIPESITDLTYQLEADASSIEFPNHNSSAETDWLTLEELINENKYYENNCDAVSGEIYQHLEETSEQYDDILKLELIQLNYNRGAHVAVKIVTADEEWVIDYTAKQFDPQLPVPLILPKAQWENLIDTHIWQTHKDDRLS